MRAIVDACADTGLIGTIENELDKVGVRIGAPPCGAYAAATPGWADDGVLGAIRLAQLHYLLPAVGILIA